MEKLLTEAFPIVLVGAAIALGPSLGIPGGTPPDTTSFRSDLLIKPEEDRDTRVAEAREGQGEIEPALAEVRLAKSVADSTAGTQWRAILYSNFTEPVPIPVVVVEDGDTATKPAESREPYRRPGVTSIRYAVDLKGAEQP